MKTKTTINNTTNEFENLDGMDNCLEKVKYPKLTVKEREDLNRPITVTEIQSIIRLFSHEKHSTSPIIRGNVS